MPRSAIRPAAATIGKGTYSPETLRLPTWAALLRHRRRAEQENARTGDCTISGQGGSCEIESAKPAAPPRESATGLASGLNPTKKRLNAARYALAWMPATCSGQTDTLHTGQWRREYLALRRSARRISRCSNPATTARPSAVLITSANYRSACHRRCDRCAASHRSPLASKSG